MPGRSRRRPRRDGDGGRGTAARTRATGGTSAARGRSPEQRTCSLGRTAPTRGRPAPRAGPVTADALRLPGTPRSRSGVAGPARELVRGPRPRTGSRRVRSLRGRRAHRHGGHGGQRRVAPAALRRDRHRSRPPNPRLARQHHHVVGVPSPEPRPLLPWVTCSSTSRNG